MNQVHTGSPERDVEVVWMERFLEQGKVYSLTDRAALQSAIELRKAAILSGLSHPTAQRWTKKLQKEVEPLLRMRFDAQFGFVIDRWIQEEGYWHQIPGTCGFDPPRPGLCERMKSQYDMWKRSSPKQDQDAIEGKARHPILQEKDRQSQAVRAENERKSTNKVLAAVDSLSSKQISNFVAVERARHTGEKLIHHGADLKFVERLDEAEKSGTATAVSADSGPDCGNPGMNPKVYKRKSGGKHILEK